MILVGRVEFFFFVGYIVIWYIIFFLGNEICEEIISLFVIRYGSVILDNEFFFN